MKFVEGHGGQTSMCQAATGESRACGQGQILLIQALGRPSGEVNV